MFKNRELYENDELPEDEEEILVHVEFPNSSEGDMFRKDKLKIEIIGIDSEKPIMQINGKFYEGTYEDAIGTHMFFQHNESATLDDPVFDAHSTLKYTTKTQKVLKMQRVFVTPRTEVLGASEHIESVPNMETIKKAGVPPKYQEEALAFWEKLRDERMEALQAYLERKRIRKEKRSQGIETDSESDEEHPLFFGVENTNDDEDFPDSSPEMDEFERFIRNTSAKPDEEDEKSSIDQDNPEPSTSKGSRSWNIQGKSGAMNRGVAKVLKTTRKRNHSKYQRDSTKRRKPIVKRVTDAISTGNSHRKSPNVILDEQERIPAQMEALDTPYENYEHPQVVERTGVGNREVINDGIPSEERSDNSGTAEISLAQKMLQKRAKREAKIKELSEQFRKMSGADEEETELEGEEEEELII